MAYKLQLPTGLSIDPISHISQLNKRPKKNAIPSPQLPLVGNDGQMLVKPVVILDRHLVKCNNAPVPQILI